MGQPPCTAVTSSTSSPSASAVANHWLRGTTWALCATATPSLLPVRGLAVRTEGAAGDLGDEQGDGSTVRHGVPGSVQGDVHTVSFVGGWWLRRPVGLGVVAARAVAAPAKRAGLKGAQRGVLAAVQEFPADGGGGRRQEDAVAEEPGGDDEAGNVSAGPALAARGGHPAQQRRVVRRSGAGPGGALQQFKFGDGGKQHLRVAEELVDAAGGNGTGCWTARLRAGLPR
jgi:hypothetical protein